MIKAAFILFGALLVLTGCSTSQLAPPSSDRDHQRQANRGIVREVAGAQPKPDVAVVPHPPSGDLMLSDLLDAFLTAFGGASAHKAELKNPSSLAGTVGHAE